jgi:ferrous iron transport protein A
MPESSSLADLPVGARALVIAVELEGPIGQRLRDLGFRADAEVECRRRAPLGDPRVYELAGSQVCLRRTEAQAVRVRPVTTP